MMKPTTKQNWKKITTTFKSEVSYIYNEMEKKHNNRNIVNDWLTSALIPNHVTDVVSLSMQLIWLFNRMSFFFSYSLFEMGSFVYKEKEMWKWYTNMALSDDYLWFRHMRERWAEMKFLSFCLLFLSFDSRTICFDFLTHTCNWCIPKGERTYV